MKHVFVETNFLIEAARPFPSPAARELLQRANSGDLRLYVPWVSAAEAKRTLDRIIRTDLGFTEAMGKFVVQDFLAGRMTRDEKKVVDDLRRRASDTRAAALRAIDTTIDSRVQQMEIIEPSKEVVAKTLSVFTVKSLKPFDEMVLGAVLTRASELHQRGEDELWFCNLNKRDFDPTNQPKLANEYAACGLKFLPTFSVPS